MSLLDKATGNFWIDNGLIVLHRQYGIHALPDDVNAIVQQMVQSIYVETGKTGEYWDESSQQIKTYNKRNWKEPIGLFISVVDQVPKPQVNGKKILCTPSRTEDSNPAQREKPTVRFLRGGWSGSRRKALPVPLRG